MNFIKKFIKIVGILLLTLIVLAVIGVMMEKSSTSTTRTSTNTREKIATDEKSQKIANFEASCKNLKELNQQSAEALSRDLKVPFSTIKIIRTQVIGYSDSPNCEAKIDTAKGVKSCEVSLDGDIYMCS